MLHNRFTILFVCLMLALAADAQTIDSLFDVLDGEVDKSQIYEAKKEAEVTRLRQNFHVSTPGIDKYLSAKQLVLSYLKFNSDSAHYYARVCYTLGAEARNKNWMNEATLYDAYVYTLRGAVNISLQALEGCDDISQLPPSLQTLYAELMLERAFHQRDLTISPAAYQKICTDTWNTYGKYLAADPILQNHYEIVMNDDKQKAPALLNRTLKMLKANKDAVSPTRSRLLEDVFILNNRVGKHETGMQYLLEMALQDIRLCNRASYSLMMIITVLETNADVKIKQLDRVMNYVSLCERNVNVYNDVSKSLWLLICQSKVRTKYKQVTERKIKSQTIMIAILALALLALSMVVWYRWQITKAKRKEFGQMQKDVAMQLGDIRAKDEQNKQLQEVVAQLEESIRRRDEGYLDGLLLNVDLINKVRDRMKTLQNLVVAKKWTDVYNKLGNDLYDNDEYKRIIQSLDQIILTVHPDFPDRFNALLRPEGRIVQPEPERLTPELRIYGLMALGLTDISSIASLLHYSTQTIYNYRLRIKRLAAVPEKEFDDRVMALYRKMA